MGMESPRKHLTELFGAGTARREVSQRQVCPQCREQRGHTRGATHVGKEQRLCPPCAPFAHLEKTQKRVPGPAQEQPEGPWGRRRRGERSCATGQPGRSSPGTEKSPTRAGAFPGGLESLFPRKSPCSRIRSWGSSGCIRHSDTRPAQLCPRLLSPPAARGARLHSGHPWVAPGGGWGDTDLPGEGVRGRMTPPDTCTNAHTYTYVHAQSHTCTHTARGHMHTNIHAHAHTRACTHQDTRIVRTCARMHTAGHGHMSPHVHVCAHFCVCSRTHVPAWGRTHTRMHSCIAHIHKDRHPNACTHTRGHKYHPPISAHSRTQTYMYTQTHTHVHILMRAHVRTGTRTHVHL